MFSCKYLHVPVFTSDYKTADSVMFSSFCGDGHFSQLILILTHLSFIYFFTPTKLSLFCDSPKALSPATFYNIFSF